MSGSYPREGGEIVAVGPDCTVRSIAAVHAAVMRAAIAGAVLRLDCGGVEEADLSFVQLVASARASLAARGGRVVVDAAPACALAAFARAGVDLPGADQAGGG